MNSFNTDLKVGQSVSTTYICGSKSTINYINYLECGNNQEFKPRDNLLCKECNGRIFYKKRTRKTVQFEAR